MQNSIELPIDSVDALRMVVGFRIDCKTLDRENENFAPGALNFANYKKIPISLFSHDRDIPIGLCENRVTKEYTVKYADNVVEGEIWFNQEDYGAREVFDLAYQRILRGVSLGFIPWEAQPNGAGPGPNGVGGNTYTNAEVVEVSLCVLPENPDGLVTFVQKSIKQPIELSEKILYHLNKYLPPERVSMILTSKPKPPVVEKSLTELITPDSLKTVATAADLVKLRDGLNAAFATREKELKGEPLTVEELKKQLELKEKELAELKKKSDSADGSHPAVTEPNLPEEEKLPGAKALRDYHDMMCAMSLKMDEINSGHENESVKEFLTGKKDLFDEEASNTRELHKKEYPDDDELKAESAADNEIPLSQVKQLVQYEKEIKLALKENAEMRAEIKELRKYSKKTNRS